MAYSAPPFHIVLKSFFLVTGAIAIAAIQCGSTDLIILRDINLAERSQLLSPLSVGVDSTRPFAINRGKIPSNLQLGLDSYSFPLSERRTDTSSVVMSGCECDDS